MVQLASRLPLQRWRVQGHDTETLEVSMRADSTSKTAQLCVYCGQVPACKPGRKFCSQTCYHLSKRKDPLENFWSKVQKQDTSGCWLWTGGVLRDGYGQFHPDMSKTVRAHRYSYELHCGPVPDGLFVLHSCPGGDNPLCVNPSHLRAGTPKENTTDMIERGRSDAGERRYNAKLSVLKVSEIRRRFAAGGITTRELAVEYQISHSVLVKALTGKTWKMVPV